MKVLKKLIFVLLFLIIKIAYNQSFLNGDFEINAAGGIDQINLPNAAFNAAMPNCNGFGTYGDLDIITSNIYSGGPQSGNWYVALTGDETDMLAIELTAPLISGNTYTISFYDKKDMNYMCYPIEIGVSTLNNSFGTSVYTAPTAAINSTWTQRTFTFTAPNNGKYITVNQQGGGLGDWVQVDNFTFEGCSLNVNIGNDTILCEGDILNLNATTTNASYLWQDGSSNQHEILFAKSTTFVPEFGTLASLVLLVAILSTIVLFAKTIPRLKMNSVF